MANTKAPKPTQTWEPVPSDEDEEAPRHSGAMRGLKHAKTILPPANMQSTVEASDDEDHVTAADDSRHATRASRGNGKVVSYVRLVAK